jgi:hypothetical protein
MSRVFHFTTKERVKKEKGTVHEAEQWRDNYKKANKRKRKKKRKERHEATKFNFRVPDGVSRLQSSTQLRAVGICWVPPLYELDYCKITKLILYVTDNQHRLYKLSTQPCRFVASRIVQIVQIVQLQ